MGEGGAAAKESEERFQSTVAQTLRLVVARPVGGLHDGVGLVQLTEQAFLLFESTAPGRSLLTGRVEK